MEQRIEIINQIIKERRSVYPPQFSGETISKETILQILENANWAPSHRKTEPWRFVVFSGEAIKDLAEFQAENYKNSTPAEDFSEAKYEKMRTKSLTCSHVIAICMQRDPKKSVPEIEEIEAVACAVQNMYLTTTAYGLGGYWGTGGVTYNEEAYSYFGLKEDERLLGFFFLGVPKSTLPEGKRGDIMEKVSFRE